MLASSRSIRILNKFKTVALPRKMTASKRGLEVAATANGEQQQPPATKQRTLGTVASTEPTTIPPLISYTNLVPASLTARYKRFLGDVLFTDNCNSTTEEKETIYVPNTGPMTGLLDALPTPVYLTKSDNKGRKYAHTLEWLQLPTGTLVGVHSASANAMVKVLLENNGIPSLMPYSKILAEVKYGSEKSRVDFVLEQDDGQQLYVEVKSVTLAETDEETGETIALFPDTVSVRAQRHVRELTAIAGQKGKKAAFVFAIQRDDCSSFAPCFEKDATYSKLVAAAVEAGVQVVAVVFALDPVTKQVKYLNEVPVRLDYKAV